MKHVRSGLTQGHEPVVCLFWRIVGHDTDEQFVMPLADARALCDELGCMLRFAEGHGLPPN